MRHRYTIAVLPFEGGQWRAVDTASSQERAIEAMLGAEGIAALRQGDLVRATRTITADGGLRHIGLAVMTEAKGLLEVPSHHPHYHKNMTAGSWVEYWSERTEAPPREMLRGCGVSIDPRRVAMIGAFVAREVVRMVGDDKGRSLWAIEALEAWAGNATDLTRSDLIAAKTLAVQAAVETPSSVRAPARWAAAYATTAPESALSGKPRVSNSAFEYPVSGRLLDLPLTDSSRWAWPGNVVPALEYAERAVYNNASPEDGSEGIQRSIGAVDRFRLRVVGAILRYCPLGVLALARHGEQPPFHPTRGNPSRARFSIVRSGRRPR